MATALTGFPTFFVEKRIGAIRLDATVEEVHGFPAELTENPIEDGSVYTDHMILLPITLEIRGRNSDASSSLFSFRAPGSSVNTFRELVDLQRRKTPFTVITGLQTYTNMVFQDLRFPRNRRTGRSVEFIALLREIQIIGAQVQTNRERIAEDVRHSFQPEASVGTVNKVPFD